MQLLHKPGAGRWGSDQPGPRLCGVGESPAQERLGCAALAQLVSEVCTVAGNTEPVSLTSQDGDWPAMTQGQSWIVACFCVIFKPRMVLDIYKWLKVKDNIF